jgi:hypothetical protein
MADDGSHVINISEVMARRKSDASLWKPRDVLEQLIKEIDSGEMNPDAMVVVYRHHEKGDEKCSKTLTGYSVSAPDMHVALGLLSRAMFQINEG